MRKSPIQPFAILMAIFWCASAASVFAVEETVTLRVVGFSHPEREADFRQVIEGLPGLGLVDLKIDQAEVTLRYDRAKLFPNVKPDQSITPDKLIAQLDQLIGQASNRTFAVTARLAIGDDQLAREEIQVGLLDCKACRYAAYEAVAKLDGVARAAVSSETGLLTVWMDAGKVNRDALIESLKKARVALPES